MAKVETRGKSATVESLVQTCIKLVCQHMSVLEERISGKCFQVFVNKYAKLLPHNCDYFCLTTNVTATATEQKDYSLIPLTAS